MASQNMLQNNAQDNVQNNVQSNMQSNAQNNEQSKKQNNMQGNVQVGMQQNDMQNNTQNNTQNGEKDVLQDNMQQNDIQQDKAQQDSTHQDFMQQANMPNTKKDTSSEGALDALEISPKDMLNPNLPGKNHKQDTDTTNSVNVSTVMENKGATNTNEASSNFTTNNSLQAQNNFTRASKPIGPKINLTAQSKTFFAGGFTLLFAFLLVIGAIRPTISDIIRIRTQLKRYKEIAVKLDDKIDTIYELKSELDARQRTLAYFDIYYPYNTDYSLFVSNLEYIVKQEKATLLSVTYSEKTKDEYVKRFQKKGIKSLDPIVFTVTIQGDYNQLLAFLKQLEQNPYLPQVISMGYRADKADQKRAFTINILLFRLKKPILSISSKQDIFDYVSSQN